MTPDLIGQARDFLNGKKSPQGVAVIGDVGIDRFVFGGVDRISPEAPVPVLLIERTQDRPGCAANVAMNLSAWRPQLRFPAYLIGVVGKDECGESLTKTLEQQGIELCFVRDDSRPTTLKTRFVAGSQHQLLRVDSESSAVVSPSVSQQVSASLRKILPSVRCLVVQDYAKGLFDEASLSQVLTEARRAGILTIVDPHPRRRGIHYKGAGLITPNVAEAELILGRSLHKGRDNEEVAQACRDLKKQLELDMAIITRSAHGMTLVDNSDKIHHFPAIARAVFDVTGAGDTVAAVLAAGLAAGLTPPAACVLATAAASVVVGKVGTASASISEILTELQYLDVVR